MSSSLSPSPCSSSWLLLPSLCSDSTSLATLVSAPLLLLCLSLLSWAGAVGVAEGVAEGVAGPRSSSTI